MVDVVLGARAGVGFGTRQTTQKIAFEALHSRLVHGLEHTKQHLNQITFHRDSASAIAVAETEFRVRQA